MARRNQNSFIRRQKEIKRVRKAKEKMARRQGKKLEDTQTFEGPLPEKLPNAESDSPPEAGKEGEVGSEA